MKREELKELHYITSISNLGSIFENGILSNKLTEKMKHISVAMSEIQAKRAVKKIPNGLYLHQYVNLYFHSRNPMMSKRRNAHKELCVLQIGPGVLDLPDVVIADQNAASDYVQFSMSPAGLKNIDYSRVFATSWKHPNNQIDEWKHSSQKCAEVLVPNRVGPEYITGAYVSCSEVKEEIEKLGLPIVITIDSDLFFQ